MTIRIAQLGDFHARADARRPDRAAALEQIIRELRATERVGLILWPGDLFDGASDPDDRNLLDQALQQLAGIAPIIVCYGNHDRAGDLDGFARLQAAWPIYVVDRPHTLRVRLAGGGNASVFVLPYPHKGGLVAAGVAPGDVVGTAAPLLDPLFIVAAGELEAAAAAGDLVLMTGHVNIAGSIVSTGQPNIGREIELSPALLDRLGPIYKGLNHIHKPQDIAGAWYAGSVVPMNYGEAEPKRYLLIEFEAASSSPRDYPVGPWSYQVRSLPIVVPAMYLLSADLTPGGLVLREPDADIAQRFVAGDWFGCDVRLRYFYRASERTRLPIAGLDLLFASAVRFKAEGIARPDRDLRAPAVAAAKTLAGKIAAYAIQGSDPDIAATLTPDVADKLSALESTESDQVLQRVAAGLAALEQEQPR